MCLEVGTVDHQRLTFTSLRRQLGEDAGEDAEAAPADPAIVERLGRTIVQRRVSPPQPIAIYEDNSTQDATIVHSRFAMRQREERLETLHLRLGQPKQITHAAPPLGQK